MNGSIYSERVPGPMRKVTLELVPSKAIVDLQKDVFETVREFEMVELLSLDYEKGVKVGVVRLRLMPGKTVGSMTPPGNMSIVEVVEENGDEAVCIIKASAPPGYEELAKRFNLDLMWTHPMTVSREKLVMSFVGEEDSIRKMVELAGFFGETTKVSVQEASFSASDLLRSLTDRQRELLIEAKKMGYYDYPRTADANDVARSLGISKSTAVEHLRKAEARLMGRILSGY